MKKKIRVKKYISFVLRYKLPLILVLLFLLNILFISQRLSIENINRNELDFALTTHYCDMLKISCGHYIFPQEVCDQSILVTKDCRSNLLGVIEYLDHMPLYFYLHKATFMIFGTSFYALFVLPFLASSLLVLFLFLFIRKMYGDAPAFLITLLYMFTFLHLQFSHEFEENLFFGMMFILTLFYLYHSLSSQSFYEKGILHNRLFWISGFIIFLLGMSHNFFLIIYPLIVLLLLCVIIISLFHKKMVYARNVFFLLIYSIILSITPYLLALQNGLNYAYDIATDYVWGNFTFDNIISPFLTMLRSWGQGATGTLDSLKSIFSLLYINDYQYFTYTTNSFSPYALVIQLIFCLSIIYYLVTFVMFLRKKKKHADSVGLLFKIFPLFAFICFIIFVSSFPVVNRSMHAFYFVFPVFFMALAGGGALLFSLCQKVYKHLFVILSTLMVLVAFFTSMHLIYMHDYDYEFLPSSSDPIFREIENRALLDAPNTIIFFINREHSCGILNDYVFYKERRLFDFDYTYIESNMRDINIYYSEDSPRIAADSFDGDIFLLSAFHCIMNIDIYEKYSELFFVENISYSEEGIKYFEAYHFFSEGVGRP